MMSDPAVDVAVQAVSIEVQHTGARGPAGADGSASLSAVAAVNLGGHRLVMLDEAGLARYADQTNEYECGRVVGMTTGAAAMGNSASILMHGLIIEPTWSWAPGLDMFLGTDGVPTQTGPLTGVSLVIGFPMGATAMFIDINPPVLQA